MRNLLALAALLAWMPVAHAAVDSKSDISVEGEFRVRFQHDQAWNTANKDADTPRNASNQRFKLGINAKLNEKFSAHMVGLHSATHGGGAAGNSQSQIRDGVADVDNMFIVQQAYGVWMVNDEFFLKFGRGTATVGDGTSISMNDWQQNPYSFDGVMFNWEKEAFRLNGFFLKIADDIAVSAGNDDPETRFSGLAYTQKSLPDFLKTAGVAVSKTDVDERAVAGPAQYSRDDMRFSAYFGGDTANVDYKATYTMHQGEEKVNGAKNDKEGSMYQVELGYSLPEMMKSRFYGRYHMDTGDKTGSDNTKFDALYYERHASSGLLDVVGWGNLTFMNFGYTFSPMDQVEMGLHYWKFERTETTDGVTANNNGNMITGGASTSADIGSEIDFAVSKKYDGGFTISSWVGAFMPGTYVKDNTGSDDTYMQFFVEGKMTF